MIQTQEKNKHHKKKATKKDFGGKNNVLGFELRPEGFTIGVADQLAYALSLLAYYLLTIYTFFFDQIFLRPNFDLAPTQFGVC